MMMAPPMNTPNGGISFKNSQTHKGAKIVSVNINNPIVTERVVFDPIVIQIKPKPSWGTPNKNPIKISWPVKLKDSTMTIA